MPDKKNILVVDDEAGIRDFVSEILEMTAYRCTVASGFPEAVAIASAPRSRIDILLTDVIIPPFQGRDLANRLVLLKPEMKVLFMSGYPLKMLKGYGLLPPHQDYLAKPFSPSQLLLSLDSLDAEGRTWSRATRVNAGE